MKKMLFNATHQEELRVAIVEGQKLINFDIETASKLQRKGNIYCGIITRVEPSLEACFVDYGTQKQGFLSFKEIDPSYIPNQTKFRDFAKLTEGIKLIVQVEKDERGNKGAALTTYISLPGRYLVLMPNNAKSGGISRRIDGEERDELKTILAQLAIPDNMSMIARTAALGRALEELQWDLNYLLKLWEAITLAAKSHERHIIYQESNLIIRSIRDHFSPDIAEILVDEVNVYKEAREFVASIMPDYVNRIKLYNDDVQLFSRFQIEHQIETAYSRAVNLPSGGSIVIDHTEALTAVDVNSAKANKGSDIEATALATNLEAADEIARQLRLRDLGGLVVVDFIDMESNRNQREVENFFKQQLGLDHARIQMGKLSKFGLLELSRQRLKASLDESTTIACPRCAGIGVIRGIESLSVHILRIIQEEAVKNNHYIVALHVQLPVEIATYLLNEKREDVSKIETRMKVQVILIPNIHLESPHYKIRKINSETQDSLAHKLSYSLVETIDDNQNNYQSNNNNQAIQNKVIDKTPVVKNIRLAESLPNNKPSLITTICNKSKLLFTKLLTIGNTSINKKIINKSNKISHKVSDTKTSTPLRTRPVTMNKSNTKIQTVKSQYNVDKLKTLENKNKTIENNEDAKNSDGNNNTKNNKGSSIAKAINNNNNINKTSETNTNNNKFNNNNNVNKKSESNDGINNNQNNHTTKNNTSSTLPPIILDNTKMNNVHKNDIYHIPKNIIQDSQVSDNKELNNQANNNAQVASSMKQEAPHADNVVATNINPKNTNLLDNNDMASAVNYDANKYDIHTKSQDIVKIHNTTIEPIQETIDIKKNTILDEVDLGEYALINTDKQLIIAHELKYAKLNSELMAQMTANQKRFNDIEIVNDDSFLHIEYILVETKK